MIVHFTCDKCGKATVLDCLHTESETRKILAGETKDIPSKGMTMWVNFVKDALFASRKLCMYCWSKENPEQLND